MKSQKMVTGCIALMIVAMLSVVTACADSKRGGGPGKGMQGPPPEAIEACEGKVEGDSVTFKGRRGESLTATCELVDDQLVAVPEGHKRR